MLEALNSTAAFYARSQSQMVGLRADAERAQSQIASGERLQRGSDDPIASSRLRALERADRLADVDASNTIRAREELRGSDTRLDDITNALLRARELAIQASNGATSETGREAIANEIASLRDTIFASANATSLTGRALFGGEAEAPAYTQDGAGNVTYVGGTGSGSLEIGQGVSVERGVNGPQVLNFAHEGAATDAFAFLAQLEADLRPGGSADPAQSARDALAGFDEAVDTVTRSQTVIGVRLAWIDTVEQAEITRNEERSIEGGAIGGVDIAEAITQMQQVLTVLEASQASFTRLSTLSLFDQI